MTRSKYFNFGEKIVLIKPMGSLDVIGQQYEVGGITDTHIIIRDCQHRNALASITYDDFDDYFIKATEMRSWTNWGAILADDGVSIAGYYRTNGKKVQVKRGTIKGEASCCPFDTFNLFLGIQIAMYRCHIKALNKALTDISEKQSNMLVQSAEIENSKNDKDQKKYMELVTEIQHQSQVYNTMLAHKEMERYALEKLIQQAYLNEKE